jgi:hypothetical protein
MHNEVLKWAAPGTRKSIFVAYYKPAYLHGGLGGLVGVEAFDFSCVAEAFAFVQRRGLHPQYYRVYEGEITVPDARDKLILNPSRKRKLLTKKVQKEVAGGYRPY